MIKNITKSDSRKIYGPEEISKLSKLTREKCLSAEVRRQQHRGEPLMRDFDKKTFRHFLSKSGEGAWPCMTYVEWGSGGSTFWALEYAQRVVSVENHVQWCTLMLKDPFIQCSILRGQLVFVCANAGPTKHFGYPVNRATYKPEIYLDALEDFDISPDFILIDGRFRVAAAMNSMKWSKPNSVLMIHDYLDRKKWNYWDIEMFFDRIPIKAPQSAVFGAFRKKRTFSQSQFELSWQGFIKDPR